MNKPTVILLLILTIVSCKKTKNQSEFKSEIDKFNEISAFFRIDSVVKTSEKIKIYATDTLTMYNDIRHRQNYFLSTALILEKSDLGIGIKKVDFSVNMPNRKDGNEPASIPVKLAYEILDYYQDPVFKKKIIDLNSINKKHFQDYLKYRGNDLVHNLNTYLADKTNNKNQWTGLDSYDIIKGYVYNRQNGIDTSRHQELFDEILTDTIYWSDKRIGKEVYNIITK